MQANFEIMVKDKDGNVVNYSDHDSPMEEEVEEPGEEEKKEEKKEKKKKVKEPKEAEGIENEQTLQMLKDALSKPAPIKAKKPKKT